MSVILQSTSIRLLVGEDRKEFLVHRKLLEKHLTDLRIPSRERFIEFDGDEESIGYLLEFLYTGDYNRPATTNSTKRDLKSHSRLETVPAPEEPVHPIILAARTSTLGVWGKPAALHTKYHHGKPAPKPQHITPNAVITNGVASPPASPSAQQKDDPIPQQSDDTASAFLAHARVYLLAERYGAKDLRDLSLKKLRVALKAFELDSPADHTTTLIKFIKSVYDPPAETAGHNAESRNRLKDAVVAHTMAYLPELQADPKFNAYIKGGGEFVADLFTALAGVRRAHH
ncbi:hypothetical protein FGG08_002829 [Glutinoglossum americanum]|uniref:BTB domain-containing protein n=1 Tax=Glutinoglossum americanum TaxID=1670608 RepID=A0A9P8L189_9PEZI|nr:hypothetical protein FGG08_002829 [Glutinoglossum americanum]